MNYFYKNKNNFWKSDSLLKNNFQENFVYLCTETDAIMEFETYKQKLELIPLWMFGFIY